MEIYFYAIIFLLVIVCGYLFMNGSKKNKKIGALQIERDSIKAERDGLKISHESLKEQLTAQKQNYEQQISSLKESFLSQLKLVKENSEKQIDTLRQMNEEQMITQMRLLKEHMKTTSENVLKAREEELGARNQEQVSKIIDPLQQSLKDMREALEANKQQQTEAMTRLDATIQANMKRSENLGESADRLSRALTGKVKVQGNFGEMELRKLLGDMGLQEKIHYDTQESLKNEYGKSIKSDDGKSLIPDFILHFPNDRHVVVDCKMSLTDYERYINATDPDEKAQHLEAHIQSVRRQYGLLASKNYTKYLPKGCNKLDFAIMYVPIEGALYLALQNDDKLWNDAYAEGVLIFGPQTMFMNLRVLEMMWTQIKQLENQQTMVDCANLIIERVQDFNKRFLDVESSLTQTFDKVSKLKIITQESGPSIITAAKNLIKAGGKQNKAKKAITDGSENEE